MCTTNSPTTLHVNSVHFTEEFMMDLFITLFSGALGPVFFIIISALAHPLEMDAVEYQRWLVTPNRIHLQGVMGALAHYQTYIYSKDILRLLSISLFLLFPRFLTCNSWSPCYQSSPFWSTSKKGCLGRPQYSMGFPKFLTEMCGYHPDNWMLLYMLKAISFPYFHAKQIFDVRHWEIQHASQLL